jgi:septum formation protein
LSLQGQGIDRVLTSDLQRARDTATLALEARGSAPLEIRELEALRERTLGDWQGHRYAELRADGRTGELIEWEGIIPGGENLQQLARRVVPALVPFDDGSTTLLVAHGGVIRVLLGLLDGWTRDQVGRRQVPNAIPIHRDLEPGSWSILARGLGPLPASGPLLVLASASPRRRQLLSTAGVTLHALVPADLPEEHIAGETPVAMVRRLALAKAGHVRAQLASGWVLGADTVVHQGDRIFGKPRDDEEARWMLGELAGGWHRVSTAWCLQGERRLRGHRTTRVRFRDLSAREIDGYVSTGECRDKAGAYGIQGLGALLVDRLVGSYSNVVGLPLEQVLVALERVGVHHR